jgi:rhodanese-related sulfurtransferase
MNTIVEDFAASNPLEAAQNRAREKSLPYRGALTPPEAHAAWQGVPGAVLIDIRTETELELIGRIPKALNFEWKLYPGWDLNPSFVTSIQRKFAPDAVLILICRSGIRSDEAATKLAKAGYENVYQVLEGFEGVLDASGQRRVNGWRSYNLPWTQA